MPRQFGGYEPDALDCNTIERAIAEDWGLCCTLKTWYNRDEVNVVCKCVKITAAPDGPVVVQSFVHRPLKSAGSLYVMHYSAMLDCWHQMDRGVLGAAARPIEHGWNGRPQVPRRRT